MNRKARHAVTIGVVLTIMTAWGLGCQQRPATSGEHARTGIIALASLPAPERQVVQFPHDLHTALGDGAKGCVTCHPTLSAREMNFSYIKVRDKLSRTAIRDSWHDKCIGCHQDYVKQGQPSGPLTCGGCHVKNLPAPPAPGRLDFYDDYHALHEDLDGGCSLCHHAYDERSEQLYYEPGVEDACASCHAQDRQGKTPSLREASHMACVSCHMIQRRQAGARLPIDCAGCHPATE